MASKSNDRIGTPPRLSDVQEEKAKNISTRPSERNGNVSPTLPGKHSQLSGVRKGSLAKLTGTRSKSPNGSFCSVGGAHARAGTNAFGGTDGTDGQRRARPRPRQTTEPCRDLSSRRMKLDGQTERAERSSEAAREEDSEENTAVLKERINNAGFCAEVPDATETSFGQLRLHSRLDRRFGGAKYKKKLDRELGKSQVDELLAEIEKKDAVSHEPLDIHSKEYADLVVASIGEKSLGLTDPGERKDFLETVIRPYAAQFFTEGAPFPELKGIKADFEQKPDAKWKMLNAYPLSFMDKIRMEFLIREQVRDGKLIKVDPLQHKLPLHASPGFIAERKGHLVRRMVVDYREFNKNAVPPVFKMPDAEAIFQNLTEGAPKYFCALDLALGYNQVELEENAQRYLAVVTPQGIFYPTRLPLGPCWAPMWFQAHTDKTFSYIHDANGVNNWVQVFIDDLCYRSDSYEELKHRTLALLKQCKDTGFCLSLRKSKFGMEQVEILGFDIGRHGRRPTLQKVHTVQEWPLPTTKDDLRSFLAYVNFCRDFVPMIYDKQAPIAPYNKQTGPPMAQFSKDPDAVRAFRNLQKSLTQNAWIKNFDLKAALHWRRSGRPIVILTDASKFGESYCMCQADKLGGTLRPFATKWHSFNQTEQGWSTLEQETHAMKFFLDNGYPLVEGLEIFLFFDHKNLGVKEMGSLWANRRVSSKMLRWLDEMKDPLESGLIHRCHISGECNIVADTMSRGAVQAGAKQHQEEVYAASDVCKSIPPGVARLIDFMFTRPGEEFDKIFTDHIKNGGTAKHYVAREIATPPDAEDMTLAKFSKIYLPEFPRNLTPKFGQFNRVRVKGPGIRIQYWMKLVHGLKKLHIVIMYRTQIPANMSANVEEYYRQMTVFPGKPRNTKGDRFKTELTVYSHSEKERATVKRDPVAKKGIRDRDNVKKLISDNKTRAWSFIRDLFYSEMTAGDHPKTYQTVQLRAVDSQGANKSEDVLEVMAARDLEWHPATMCVDQKEQMGALRIGLCPRDWIISGNHQPDKTLTCTCQKSVRGFTKKRARLRYPTRGIFTVTELATATPSQLFENLIVSVPSSTQERQLQDFDESYLVELSTEIQETLTNQNGGADGELIRTEPIPCFCIQICRKVFPTLPIADKAIFKPQTHTNWKAPRDGRIRFCTFLKTLTNNAGTDIEVISGRPGTEQNTQESAVEFDVEKIISESRNHQKQSTTWYLGTLVFIWNPATTLALAPLVDPEEVGGRNVNPMNHYIENLVKLQLNDPNLRMIREVLKLTRTLNKTLEEEPIRPDLVDVDLDNTYIQSTPEVNLGKILKRFCGTSTGRKIGMNKSRHLITHTKHRKYGECCTKFGNLLTAEDDDFQRSVVVPEGSFWKATDTFEHQKGVSLPLKHYVVREVHRNPDAAAHSGARVTEAYIQRCRLWWEDRKKDVDAYIAKCLTCSSLRPSQGKLVAARSEVGQYFNEILFMDHVHMPAGFEEERNEVFFGRYPLKDPQFGKTKAHRGAPGRQYKPENRPQYNFILGVICACTGMVWLRPTMTRELDEVKPILKEIFESFGTPRVLRSDNGFGDTSQKARTLETWLGSHFPGCRYKTGSAYNPQSQHHIERIWGRVKRTLKIYGTQAKVPWNTRGKETALEAYVWPMFLQKVELRLRHEPVVAYNGKSPIELIGGRPNTEYVKDCTFTLETQHQIAGIEDCAEELYDDVKCSQLAKIQKKKLNEARRLRERSFVYGGELSTYPLGQIVQVYEGKYEEEAPKREVTSRARQILRTGIYPKLYTISRAMDFTYHLTAQNGETRHSFKTPIHHHRLVDMKIHISDFDLDAHWVWCGRRRVVGWIENINLFFTHKQAKVTWYTRPQENGVIACYRRSMKAYEYLHLDDTRIPSAVRG